MSLRQLVSRDRDVARTFGVAANSRWFNVLILLWFILILTGTARLWAYQLTAGRQATPPHVWPTSGQLPRHVGRPLLIMVAHPQCSCTRASLNQLERLTARFSALDSRPDVYLSVITEESAETNRSHSAIVEAASRIQGLQVLMDHGGKFAERLGAKVSGTVLLYASNGNLLFSGGITDARGHEGDAIGQRAILAALFGKPSPTDAAPAFGCGLQ